MLSSYPNVYNSCLVILQRKGFALSYEKETDTWLAEIKGFKFKADNPIELLGLTAIYEDRKPESDSEYWWQINSPYLLGELDPES
jgi:hypothetical protein